MYVVHLVHVLSMAVAVGGGLAGALQGGSRRLEAVHWGALAALVVTGVGNVGRYGDALPAVGTAWGTVLLAKLVLVLILLGVSVRRSHAVWRGRPAAAWHAATAAVAAGVAGLGVWLAHG